MSSNGQEPTAEQIRADIEHTRERLGDTVEALGAHLNPSLLKARVTESVHEATIGRAKTMARNVRDKAAESGRGLIHTIRDNPLPVALIAGGIGWLMFSKRRHADDAQWSDRDEALTGLEAGGPEAVTPGVGDIGSAGVTARSSYESVTVDYSQQLPDVGNDGDGLASKVKSAGGRAAEGARSAGEHVVSGARAAGDKVVTGARAAGERVSTASSNLAHTVADRARAGGRRVGETYDSNPMVLGAVAAAVGLAIGMTLPVSEQEARLMGGKRDELMDKARETLGETKDKVRHAAERAVPEVKETLREVAREEGLTGA